jgi:hypothetical protein
LARLEIVEQQRSRRLASDQDAVAGRDVLEARGQGRQECWEFDSSS